MTSDWTPDVIWDRSLGEYVQTPGRPTPSPGPDPELTSAHFEEKDADVGAFDGLHQTFSKYPDRDWIYPKDEDAPFSPATGGTATPSAGARGHFEQMLSEGELDIEDEIPADVRREGVEYPSPGLTFQEISRNAHELFQGGHLVPAASLLKYPDIRVPHNLGTLSNAQAFVLGAAIDANIHDHSPAIDRLAAERWDGDPNIHDVSPDQTRHLVDLYRTHGYLLPEHQLEAAIALGKTVRALNIGTISGAHPDMLLDAQDSIVDLLHGSGLSEGEFHPMQEDSMIDPKTQFAAIFADLAIRRLQLQLDNGEDCSENPAAHGCDELRADRAAFGLGPDW